MACKKALEEAQWDQELAVDILRKKWITKAAEKSWRETHEWKIFIKWLPWKVAMIRILCETDFVASNDNVAAFWSSVLDYALKEGKEKAVDFWNDKIKSLIATLWENMQVDSVEVLESQIYWSYIHSNWKIWVVVTLDWWNEEVARGLAMHVAGMNPKFTDPSEVDNDLIAREKSIWIELLKKEWKPEKIIENILIGKEKKFREESSLKTQAFVRDTSITCEQYAKQNWGVIKGFVRLSI